MKQKNGQRNDEQLLHTKLEIPNLAHRIVRRVWLTDILQTKEEKHVSLIVAPAGYGKTTLLSEWISVATSGDNRFAWITLDSFDNSPFRFWSYIISAIKKAMPHLQFNSETLIQHGFDPLDFTRLIPFINEIGQQPYSINLILDDYHVITSDHIHRSVSYLIDHQPRNLHLILASRMKPPLPLTRLRTMSRFIEINAKNLSFTFDETRMYLSDVAKLNGVNRYASEIFKVTQGWIAGLQLAAIALTNKFDLRPNLLADLGTSNEFPDYFSEEVLSQQNSLTREFLLKTSILNDFCVDLCDFLLGIKDSQLIIDQLLEDNLFITPLDRHQSWYRWHPLFSRALNHQLEKDYPNEIPDLHRKAVQWLIENNYPDKAVVHTLSMNQMDKAAEIIDSLAMRAIINFDLSRLIHWINAIPDHFLEVRPSLGIYNATAFFLLGQYEMIEPNLQKSEKILVDLSSENQKEEEYNRLLWEIKAIRAAVVCIKGAPARGISLGEELIGDETKESSYYFGMLIHAMAFAHEILGELKMAVNYYDEGRRVGIENNFLYGYFHSSCAMAIARKKQGRLKDAAHLFKQALDFAIGLNLENATITLAQAGLLDIALEQNEKIAGDLAKKILTDFDKTIISESAWISHIMRCLVLVNFFVNQSDLDAAHQYFDLALSSYHDLVGAGLPIPPEVIDVRARVLRATAKQKGITKWFQSEDEFLNSTTFNTVPGQIATTKIQMSQNKNDEAVSILKGLLEDLKYTEFAGRMIEAKVLLALALYATQQKTLAFETIAEALRQGWEESYVRVFLEESAPMRDLLHEFLQSSQFTKNNSEDLELKSYIQTLIHALDNESSRNASLIIEKESRVMAILPIREALSSRENDVFRLLLKGKSSKEIAELLMISLNTTKTHIKNVYSKLGVHSQKKLIQRGEELGQTE